MRRLISYRPRRLARREAPSLFQLLLLPSVLGVCVCSLLLLGSTWAWFAAAARSDVGAVQSAEFSYRQTTTSQKQTLADLDELSDEKLLALVVAPEEQTFAAYAEDTELDIAPYDAAQTDLALLARAKADCANLLSYQETTVTYTATGTASTGYFIVTFGGMEYPVGPLTPGQAVELTIAGTLPDGFLAVEAYWGTMASPSQLEALKSACAERNTRYLSGLQTEYLTELQRQYSALVAEEIDRRAEETRQAAEEARLAEEAAAQQGTEDGWPQEDAGAFYFVP